MIMIIMMRVKMRKRRWMKMIILFVKQLLFCVYDNDNKDDDNEDEDEERKRRLMEMII